MKKYTYPILLCAIIFISTLSVSAQDIVPGGGHDPGLNPTTTILLSNPAGINTLNDLSDKIIDFLTVIMVPILTIVVLIGGFKMLTARDNEAKFNEGKKTVTYAAIGAAVVLVANGIILVINSFLEVQ